MGCARGGGGAEDLPWTRRGVRIEGVPLTDEIRRRLSELPHKPGVYLMKDRLGTVIYVGKARDLRRRVSQYFHPSRRMGWDLKLNALVDSIFSFDVHTVRNEPESLLLEAKLIKELKPRFNIDFRDDKRFLLLKVQLNDPIPRFTLTRFRKEDGARYFGPFAHSGALRRTLTLLRRRFSLRGCRALTPTEVDYRHCLYGNLRHCTAPCVGNVTREEYVKQVVAACDFLDGQTDEIRGELEGEMRKAAERLEFERAAQLRDAIEDLKRTTQKTEKFERMPYTLPVAIHPEADMRALGVVLGLPSPPFRIEGFDISNISGTFMVASMVSFWHGRPDRSNYRRFRMKSVVAQDDFACMAETIRRRYTRLLGEVRASSAKAPASAGGEASASASASASETDLASVSAYEAAAPAVGGAGEVSAPWIPRAPTGPRLPDLILIDGGKGQLNAACAELEALGLGGIPIIGLAKEFEEIYRPGESEPLRLGLDHGALKLLQRVRDESHRFANTYNAQLRLKKVSESLLDEFPGIGERRKSELLKRFGSVQRLKTASVADLAAVSGIGERTAVELHAFLAARKSE